MFFSKMVRTRDAEADLNLPPGFRFHPTDEELVVHYLCRKITYQCLPVPIIAEVDLYKYNPWQLPDKALFGQREWYFFTPRDRKYPNGSRPNRAAGSGYWKATGADKPVTPNGSARPVGIKKALVFYTGKAPKGVKTNWIMHEYRLADTNRAANKKGSSLRLDDWVICRLYNKKNSWEKMQRQTKEASLGETTIDSLAAEDTGSDSFRTPVSDVDDDVFTELLDGPEKPSRAVIPSQASNEVQAPWTSVAGGIQTAERIKEDNDWFTDLNLDDLQNSAMDLSYQDYFFSGLTSPQLRSNHLPACHHYSEK